MADMKNPSPSAGTVRAPRTASDPARALPPHTSRMRREAAAYGTDTQQALRHWIEENQTVALLAGFAFGVFIGAWMRG